MRAQLPTTSRPVHAVFPPVALLLVLLCTKAAPAYAQEAPPPRVGDVNGDGEITAVDALSVLNHAVGRPLPAGHTADPDGDANGDGQLTAADALVVLSHVVGRDVSRFPVGGPLVASVELTPDSAEVFLGETLHLRAVLRDGRGREVRSAAPAWTVDDTAVAALAADGRVTGRGYGYATLLASVGGARAGARLRVAPRPGETAVPASTRAVTAEEARRIVSIDSASVTFAATSALARGLRPGDVLLGDGSPQAPAGLLRRVTAVTAAGDRVVAATEPARLTDAVWQATLRVTGPLEPAPGAALAPGVRMTGADGEEGFTVEFLDHQVRPGVKVSGSLTLRSELDFELDIQDRVLRRAAVRLLLSDSAALTVHLGIDAELPPTRVTLHTIPLRPVAVMVPTPLGPLPLYLHPKLTLQAGISGKAVVGAQAGVSWVVTEEAGFAYANGALEPIHSFSQRTHLLDRVVPVADVEVKAFLGPRLDVAFVVEGLLAAWIDANAYARLGVAPLEDPWFGVHWGVESNAGLYSDWMDDERVSIGSAQLFEWERPLYQGRARARVSAPATAVPVGGALQLAAEFTDSTGTLPLPPRAVEWSSGDAAVVAVDAGGRARGVAPGAAWIRAARANTLPDSVRISVDAGGVEVTPASAELRVGESLPFSATVRDAAGRVVEGAAPAWSTSAPGVATVSASGVVTAVGPGSATIRAEALGHAGTATVHIPGEALAGWARIGPALTHTCGLAADGQAYCWGDGSQGQLGNGGTASSFSPVPVQHPTGVRFTSLSVSVGYNCALSDAGQAYCWGDGLYYRLGNGAERDRATPTAVLQPEGVSFASVVTSSTACGLTPSGQAYCWGSNEVGTVGTGRVGAQVRAPERVAQPAGVSFTALSVGSSTACGLSAAGRAYCWGDNGFGELGDGTLESRSTPTAVAHPAGVSFVALAAGATSCGLTSAGQAYCWGENSRGGVGDGGSANRLVPTAVHQPAGVAFVALAGGINYTCGLTAAGQAYCWGANETGGLGDGTRTNRHVPTAVAQPAGVAFVSTAAWGGSTCALTAAGAAYCWGDNRNGQLGDGTTTTRLTPVPVPPRR